MSVKSPRILSCFIDETGDFGDYDYHCPYYMISAVLHDQNISIESELNNLEKYLSNIGYTHHAIHAGPLIRRENDYEDLSIEERKKLFNLLFNFTRRIPIHFFCVMLTLILIFILWLRLFACQGGSLISSCCLDRLIFRADDSQED